MKASFIFFLSLVYIMVFLCHWYIYFSLIRLLPINNLAWQKGLFILIVLLTSSYFVAHILVNWRATPFNRIIYFAVNFWVGLGVYIILALSYTWLIFLWLGYKSPSLTILFLLWAVLYAVYAVYNSMRINVKKINITIKNLPEYWQNKKIVQIADLHLGPVMRSGFLKKIIKKINLQKAELLVIVGDYFDGVKHEDTDLVRPLRKVETKQGIYFVYGNHDAYHGKQVVKKKLNDYQVKVLDNEIVTLHGLQLIGASYIGLDAGEKYDLQDLLKKINPKIPSIMLQHEPNKIKEIAASGVDLLLCGHTHHGQFWPYKYITRIIYKKFYAGLHYSGLLRVYTTSGIGTWGPPLRTGNRPEIAVITLQNI